MVKLILQEASTCHIRGIHFINGGTVFEKLLAVIKPFLNADVMKMVSTNFNYIYNLNSCMLIKTKHKSGSNNYRLFNDVILLLL